MADEQPQKHCLEVYLNRIRPTYRAGDPPSGLVEALIKSRDNEVPRAAWQETLDVAIPRTVESPRGFEPCGEWDAHFLGVSMGVLGFIAALLSEANVEVISGCTHVWTLVRRLCVGAGVSPELRPGRRGGICLGDVVRGTPAGREFCARMENESRQRGDEEARVWMSLSSCGIAALCWSYLHVSVEEARRNRYPQRRRVLEQMSMDVGVPIYECFVQDNPFDMTGRLHRSQLSRQRGRVIHSDLWSWTLAGWDWDDQCLAQLRACASRLAAAPRRGRAGQLRGHEDQAPGGPAGYDAREGQPHDP